MSDPSVHWSLPFPLPMAQSWLQDTGFSEPEDNQHPSWAMCSRECVSASTAHTEPTTEIKFSYTMDILIVSAYLKF